MDTEGISCSITSPEIELSPLVSFPREAVSYILHDLFRIAESSEWIEFEKDEIEAISHSDQLIVNEDTLVESIIRFRNSVLKYKLSYGSILCYLTRDENLEELLLFF